MSSPWNRLFGRARVPVVNAALVALVCAAPALAEQTPPEPPQICGAGTFPVFAPSGTLQLPKGCSMYLLIVSDHGRNTQMNELTFYPLAKWVAENGGYVHWAWWNNLLREYMAQPLGVSTPPPYSSQGGSELQPLPPQHLFSANPGTPSFTYPGLLERDWWQDGLVPILQFVLERVILNSSDTGIVPAAPVSNASFVADARAFLSTIRTENPEALIFAVGHGFGAGSLNVVFEGITNVDIDLVALIDPVGPENTPGALRTNLNTHRGSQWRAKRKFLGYRQADCIRNETFPFGCKDHAPGLFQFDYRCRPQGRPADTPTGWLDEPPGISSRAPLHCSGPIIHAGTLYRTLSSAPNIRRIVHRTQPESRIPINPSQSVSPLLTCRTPTGVDPIIRVISQQAAEHQGALPWPDALNSIERCNPDDGHDELIGDRGLSESLDLSLAEGSCEFDFGTGFARPWLSAIATNLCDVVDGALVKLLFEHWLRPGNDAGLTRQTGRLPYGSIVTGLTTTGPSDLQEFMGSIGRPVPTEPWPACAICVNGLPTDDDSIYHKLSARAGLPSDMAYSANSERRREALISLATPGPSPFQPLLPELCLVCDELIAIASGMLDENTPDDTSSPTTAAHTSPEPNDNGWIAADAVVTLAASDNAGGSGVREIAVTTTGAETGATVHSGSTAELPIQAEGITEVTFAARDHADNEESPPQTLLIRIDKTPPVIESVAMPPPNAAGWNRSDVTVGFSATDPLSGLATLSPTAPIVVTTEGQDQEVGGNAADLAGNESSAGRTVSIDKTAPEISLVERTAPNAAGWNNTAVTLTWTCTDALSGPVVGQVSQLLTAEGAGQQATATCADFADLTSSHTAGAINIDRTGPSAHISAPADGAVYLLNAMVNAAYSCADALSGVSACAAGVASGAALDTATVGNKTLTVEAADIAGNHGSISHAYSVQYAFSGFANPIVAMPSMNTAKAGRTVPVKFSLRDVNGATIADLASFRSFTSAPVACDSNVPTAPAEETDAAGSSTIRYESGQFVYNWRTDSVWAVTCRVLQLTLNDGTRHMVAFQFK